MESGEKREAGKRKSSIGTEHFWGLDKMEQAYGHKRQNQDSQDERIFRILILFILKSRKS
jgi:hypothetical protein